MTRETCKALLANGVLQAYADGQTIEHTMSALLSPSSWTVIHEPAFDSRPSQYRIKPTPTLTGDEARKLTGRTVKSMATGSTHTIGRVDGGINPTIYVIDYGYMKAQELIEKFIILPKE